MADNDWKARRRAAARRPITDEEVPHLVAWGAELRRLRRASPYTRAEVVAMASISLSYLDELEMGTRRPRRETVESLLVAILDDDDLEEPAWSQHVAAHVAMLGPALAPPSDYAEKVERTRRRRARKKLRFHDAVELRATELARKWTAENAERRRARGFE